MLLALRYDPIGQGTHSPVTGSQPSGHVCDALASCTAEASTTLLWASRAVAVQVPNDSPLVETAVLCPGLRATPDAKHNGSHVCMITVVDKQLDEPSASLTKEGGHSRQVPLGCGSKPASHTQASDTEPRASVVSPAGQAVQDALPTSLFQYPAAQTVTVPSTSVAPAAGSKPT